MPYLGGTLGIAIRRGEIPGLRDFLLRIRPDSHHNNSSENSLLVYYLGKVNFTTSFGDQVSFDENGDALPIYDVMNWVWLPDGRTKVQNVGVVKESVSTGEELTMNEDKIFWNFELKEKPLSVCSESCRPGTRMARKKGQPVCCYDCIPCSEGKISNKTDSMECTSCPEDFWSNPQRDDCVPKRTEFLSYHEPLGICLTTASLLGTCICTFVLGIFIYHRSTPMVRANNSELSFLLLLSLKLCFLCSLLFIGRPQLWTCQLRHAAFGISFVLCVSCILVKTMVVLAVFKASKPGGGATLKWFGAIQQRGTVLVLTSIQAAICTAWLVSSSPFPHKNTKYHNDKIVYECVVGSTGQFHLNGMYKAGDVVLGGLFEIHFFSILPELSFTSEPQDPTCHGFDVLGFRQTQTMAFAIDEINRNSNLLPNVTLGYSLYDNCVKLAVGFRAGLSLISGQEKQFTMDETCTGNPPVIGIVGDSSSTRSIAISSVLGLYKVPMVRAMIQILKHFGWTWAGLLVSDDDYGLHAARSFQSDLVHSGTGCLAYAEVLPWGNDPAQLRKIVDVMRKSTARVVIVFAHESNMIYLMEEVVKQNVTGLQWMASEAWTAADVLQTPQFMPYLGGTLGIAIRRGEIPGLRDFLLRIRPGSHHDSSYGNNMVRV
ncbi:hypothetical protein LDENG_00121810 [Lucifuga dentata]|nr:hypothetical protein LDENG_00121810 [Lucifuga dentata]